MRLLGAAWMFFLIWLVGRNSGSFVVYLEAWAFIGGLAMVMTLVAVLFAATRLGAQPWVEMEPNEIPVDVAAKMVERHFQIWGSIGFIIGSLIGAFLVNSVIS